MPEQTVKVTQRRGFITTHTHPSASGVGSAASQRPMPGRALPFSNSTM